MASSTSIEIEHIRADVEQAAANLNAIVARLHARTGRGLRDSLSLLFSVPEITALQQHASQASQYLTSGSARAATWSRSLHVQLSASTAQCQQFAVDDETLSAELSRVDEYMRGATRRMLEQARRLTGSNDSAQFAFQQQNNASSSPAQTCLAAIAHVLKIVDAKSQNSAAGVGGSRQFTDPRRTHDRDAELRSLTGIKTELTELRTYVSAEAARITGLASHVATLRRQRAALDTQNAQITALMRDMAETRRSLDSAAGTAAQMTAMASLTSTVRGTKQVAVELQRIPHGVQPRIGIEMRPLAELDSARQAMARGA